MTIGDKPIFHIRVKKASAVNIKGAMINSYSSRKERTEKAWDKEQLAIALEIFVQGEIFCK